MPQIRLNRTPELEKVLTFLQEKYRLLSEAEIIKVALSEKYYKETQEAMEKEQKEQQIRRAYNHLMAEGKKLGDNFLAKKRLKRTDVNEEQFYHLIKNP